MKNKIIVALLSLLASFALWMYVITVVSPGSEASFTVQVEVDNESVLNQKGWMLKPNQNLQVHLNLSGNRSDLIKLTNKNIIVKVDASKITGNEPEQTAQLNYTIAYPGNVPNNAISVISRNPDYIELEYIAYAESTVPVKETYVGTPEGGYAISSAVFSAPELNISGPAELVEKIVVARVEIDQTGLKESISKDMPFTYYDKDGKVVSGEFITSEELGSAQQVGVQLVVQPAKEIPVTIELIPGGGATADNCTVQLSYETITVAGDAAALSLLDKLELEPVELSKMTEMTDRFSRKVKLPAGITNLSSTEEIIVIVTMKDLAKKEFTVTDIRAKNTGDLQAEFPQRELKITVRGPKAQIEKLKAEDVIAYADFTDKPSVNLVDVPVEFVINNVQDVGVVGSYTIKASLKESAAAQ